LAAKRRLVKRVQAHRKFWKDPADVPGPTDAQENPPPTGQRYTDLRVCLGGTHRKCGQATATDMASPPDTRTIVERQRSPSERRVTTCTVDLGGAWYAPATISASATGMASIAEHPRDPSFEEEAELAPPAKAQRPEGMPEVGSALAPYQLPPVEDDAIAGHEQSS